MPKGDEGDLRLRLHPIPRGCLTCPLGSLIGFERTGMESVPTVIGIDVGGSRKGFHAVALTEGAHTAQLDTREVQELAHWCRSVIGASVIAIDAPCRWSVDGRARPCERQLNAEGIRCFASTTRERAMGHPSNYYGWMLQGEALYRELEASHPLLTVLPARGPVCLETFPHAITWHLHGSAAQAARKRSQRRELLARAGMDLAPLTSIDRIDAALCALAANHVAIGAACHVYGEPDTGLIVVPTSACPSAVPRADRPECFP